MEQSGQLCVPAGLVPGKCPPMPDAMAAGWVTGPVRSLWSREAALLDGRPAGRIFVISWAIPRLHTRLTSLACVYCYLTFSSRMILSNTYGQCSMWWCRGFGRESRGSDGRFSSCIEKSGERHYRHQLGAQILCVVPDLQQIQNSWLHLISPRHVCFRTDKVLTRNTISQWLTHCRGSYSSCHIHRPITFHLVPWTRRQQVQSERPHVTTNIRVTYIKTQQAVSFSEVTAKRVISTDFHLVSLGTSRRIWG